MAHAREKLALRVVRLLRFQLRSRGLGRARHDTRLELGVQAEDFFFSAASLVLLFALRERAANRRGQPDHPLLQDVVGGARLQPLGGDLFAECPRDEDERRGRLHLGGQQLGLQAVERRQLEVGENDLEVGCVQLADEVVARLHTGDLDRETIRSHCLRRQFGVEVVVFEVQQAQGHRAGGGSFKTAQKPPSTRTACTNSGKSTGLTTYALTPRS